MSALTSNMLFFVWVPSYTRGIDDKTYILKLPKHRSCTTKPAENSKCISVDASSILTTEFH